MDALIFHENFSHNGNKGFIKVFQTYNEINEDGYKKYIKEGLKYWNGEFSFNSSVNGLYPKLSEVKIQDVCPKYSGYAFITTPIPDSYLPDRIYKFEFVGTGKLLINNEEII